MRFAEIFERGEDHVRWAVGKDLDKSIANKWYQKNPEYTILNANIEDMFRLTDRYSRLDLKDPTGGENAIGKRIPRAADHWKSGGYMDPAEVSINDSPSRINHPVSIGNGRHRLYVAFQMGHQYAPVLIHNDEVAKFKKIVRTQA
jgi:hypothetical protein